MKNTLRVLGAVSIMLVLSSAVVFAEGRDARQNVGDRPNEDQFEKSHPHAFDITDHHMPVCTRPSAADDVRCNARVVVDRSGTPAVTSLPSGLSPQQIHSAYTLPVAALTPTTIAIVDAYDDPTIYTDLTNYSKTYGIPVLPQCTTGSTVPCFKKVNQRGGTSAPQANSNWALEIALDVEVAHATCQNCSITLVEADSASYANLMAAVDRAVLLGATVVSNSYGSSEFSGETAYDSHFNHAGVAFTFSSGDAGFGAEYPAASPYVTAVGGTSLTLNSNNTYQSESVWSSAGSGCSVFESKLSTQVDPGCAQRTIADVSAVADPNTGAAVLDTYRTYSRSGWFKVGGTSLASPIIAGVYALSGNTAGYANTIPYANAAFLHDVTSGSNGTCNLSYLCNAGVGFDGPTGLGTPNGIGAF